MFPANKKFIFIISAGRTGTKFMGNVLSSMIEKSFSVHEPDSLDFEKNLSQNLKTIKLLGIKGSTLGKIKGDTGIYNLSRKYLSNQISEEAVKKEIIRHRQKYYQRIDADLIIESHYGWYGLIPIIKQMYSDVKIVLMYRDPLTWITSNMNWGTLYGKRDYLEKYFKLRINPCMVNDSTCNEWNDYDQFQKLCWNWVFVNGMLQKENDDGKNTFHVKYEDLFIDKNKNQNFSALLKNVCSFNAHLFQHEFNPDDLKRIYNSGKTQSFPSFEKWPTERQDFARKMCLNLNRKLGYTDF